MRIIADPIIWDARMEHSKKNWRCNTIFDGADSNQVPLFWLAASLMHVALEMFFFSFKSCSKWNRSILLNRSGFLCKKNALISTLLPNQLFVIVSSEKNLLEFSQMPPDMLIGRQTMKRRKKQCRKKQRMHETYNFCMVMLACASAGYVRCILRSTFVKMQMNS